jgi:hypothetical protein
MRDDEGSLPGNFLMRKDLPVARLLHDNMTTVITFTFSYWPIKRLIKQHDMFYRRMFEDFAFEAPGRNAIRACLEIAVLIRLLDDRRGFLGDKPSCFGVVHRMDGTEEPLTLRELTNKIIHAETRYWDQSRENDPKLICIAPDDQQKQFGWVRAEVSIVNLALFCGGLAPELIIPHSPQSSLIDVIIDHSSHSGSTKPARVPP